MSARSIGTDALVRAIGVPIAVAALEARLNVLLIHHAAIFVNIGHAAQASCVATPQAAFQAPETASKGEMIVGAQVLARKHQHRIAMPGIFDGGEGGGVQMRQIDLAHRCTQSRATRFDALLPSGLANARSVSRRQRNAHAVSGT